MAEQSVCSVPGCDKRAKTRGWCSAHYERWRLHGDPLGSGPNPLRRYRNERVTLACSICGTVFHPFHGREATSKVCSIRCNGALQSGKPKNELAYFLERVSKTDTCWIWTGGLNEYGYGMVNIGRKRHYRAHRLSYELFRGPIPKGAIICHSCDNPPCVNPDHLWAGSHKDNLADMSAKGRAHKGPSVHSEMHPLSKITREIALMIRSDPRSAPKIASEHGVSPSLVRGIKAGTHWKYALRSPSAP
jgi:hypothetical protein